MAQRRHSWKRVELRIAELLGGKRVPITGRTYTHRQRATGARVAPDIEHPWMALEVKSWARIPGLVLRALMQAERVAAYVKRKQGIDKLPVAIIHADRTNMGNSLVVMRLKDMNRWYQWYVIPDPEAEPEEEPSPEEHRAARMRAVTQTWPTVVGEATGD